MIGGPQPPAAAVFSASRSFRRAMKQRLERHGFTVAVEAEPERWSPGENDADIRLAVVDTGDGAAPSAAFLDTLLSTLPHITLITVGPSPPSDLSLPANHFHITGDQLPFDDLLGALQRAIMRDQHRGELASLLIHDIRSPLNSMVGYLELLMNQTLGSLNEGQQGFVEKAATLGDQVLEMLEDINEIYRNEQYRFTLEREPVALKTIVNQALLNIWVQAEHKKIQINKRIPILLPKVVVDAFQVQRVLVNLLENAIKYCPENTTVTISARKTGRQFVKVTVRDTGVGIPEDQLPRVFGKSIRYHDAATHQRGLGLGLYICRLIIKAHRGSIRAENHPDGGVAFIFTLPTH